MDPLNRVFIPSVGRLVILQFAALTAYVVGVIFLMTNTHPQGKVVQSYQITWSDNDDSVRALRATC